MNWDNYNDVLKKMNECGKNLKHASERLKDSTQIVLAAIKQDKDSIKYASERIRGIETTNAQFKLKLAMQIRENYKTFNHY